MKYGFVYFPGQTSASDFFNFTLEDAQSFHQQVVDEYNRREQEKIDHAKMVEGLKKAYEDATQKYNEAVYLGRIYVAGLNAARYMESQRQWGKITSPIPTVTISGMTYLLSQGEIEMLCNRPVVYSGSNAERGIIVADAAFAQGKAEGFTTTPADAYRRSLAVFTIQQKLNKFYVYNIAPAEKKMIEANAALAAYI